MASLNILVAPLVTADVCMSFDANDNVNSLVVGTISGQSYAYKQDHVAQLLAITRPIPAQLESVTLPYQPIFISPCETISLRGQVSSSSSSTDNSDMIASLSPQAPLTNLQQLLAPPLPAYSSIAKRFPIRIDCKREYIFDYDIIHDKTAKAAATAAEIAAADPSNKSVLSSISSIFSTSNTPNHPSQVLPNVIPPLSSTASPESLAQLFENPSSLCSTSQNPSQKQHQQQQYTNPSLTIGTISPAGQITSTTGTSLQTAPSSSLPTANTTLLHIDSYQPSTTITTLASSPQSVHELPSANHSSHSTIHSSAVNLPTSNPTSSIAPETLGSTRKPKGARKPFFSNIFASSAPSRALSFPSILPLGSLALLPHLTSPNQLLSAITSSQLSELSTLCLKYTLSVLPLITPISPLPHGRFRYVTPINYPCKKLLTAQAQNVEPVKGVHVVRAPNIVPCSLVSASPVTSSLYNSESTYVSSPFPIFSPVVSTPSQITVPGRFPVMTPAPNLPSSPFSRFTGTSRTAVCPPPNIRAQPRLVALTLGDTMVKLLPSLSTPNVYNLRVQRPHHQRICQHTYTLVSPFAAVLAMADNPDEQQASPSPILFDTALQKQTVLSKLVIPQDAVPLYLVSTQRYNPTIFGHLAPVSSQYYIGWREFLADRSITCCATTHLASQMIEYMSYFSTAKRPIGFVQSGCRLVSAVEANYVQVSNLIPISLTNQTMEYYLQRDELSSEFQRQQDQQNVSPTSFPEESTATHSRSPDISATQPDATLLCNHLTLLKNVFTVLKTRQDSIDDEYYAIEALLQTNVLEIEQLLQNIPFAVFPQPDVKQSIASNANVSSLSSEIPHITVLQLIITLFQSYIAMYHALSFLFQPIHISLQQKLGSPAHSSSNTTFLRSAPSSSSLSTTTAASSPNNLLSTPETLSRILPIEIHAIATPFFPFNQSSTTAPNTSNNNNNNNNNNPDNAPEPSVSRLHVIQDNIAALPLAYYRPTVLDKPSILTLQQFVSIRYWLYFYSWLDWVHDHGPLALYYWTPTLQLDTIFPFTFTASLFHLHGITSHLALGQSTVPSVDSSRQRTSSVLESRFGPESSSLAPSQSTAGLTVHVQSHTVQHHHQQQQQPHHDQFTIAPQPPVRPKLRHPAHFALSTAGKSTNRNIWSPVGFLASGRKQLLESLRKPRQEHSAVGQHVLPKLDKKPQFGVIATSHEEIAAHVTTTQQSLGVRGGSVSGIDGGHNNSSSGLINHNGTETNMEVYQKELAPLSIAGTAANAHEELLTLSKHFCCDKFQAHKRGVILAMIAEFDGKLIITLGSDYKIKLWYKGERICTFANIAGQLTLSSMIVLKRVGRVIYYSCSDGVYCVVCPFDIVVDWAGDNIKTMQSSLVHFSNLALSIIPSSSPANPSNASSGNTESATTPNSLAFSPFIPLPSSVSFYTDQSFYQQHPRIYTCPLHVCKSSNGCMCSTEQ